MKKLLVLLVTFILIFTLVGCENTVDTSELESRITQLEKDLETEQTKLTNANVSLSDAQAAVLIATSELEMLQSNFDATDEDLTDAVLSLELSQDQLQIAQGELQTLQRNLQTAQGELQVALITIEQQAFNGTLGTEILVDADEENGFNFPYLLYYPNESIENTYLLVESYNASSSNTTNDIDITIAVAIQYGTREGITIGSKIAERMNLPRIMPIIPRLAYVVKNQEGFIIDYGHPHGLDRTTMLIEDYIDDVYVWPEYEIDGIDNAYFEKLFNLEEQIYNMIVDAQNKLTQNNYQCNEKVFITGYSASGSFASRFTSFYPTKVKAMFSGGMHVPFVPATTYQNHDLIYGIGASDHMHINGKEFNLNDYNNVSKMMFLGLLDDNDPLPYSGVFSVDQRELAILLYGNDWLTRWNNVKDVYYEVGGTGLFVESKSLGHAYSPELISLIEQFFTINMNSQTPNYSLDCQSEDLICIIN